MQSETAAFAHAAATWRTRRNIRAVFVSGLVPALYENMTSSTKPEVHNILRCPQRRRDSRPHVTCTENYVKYGHVFLDMQADRQTDRQTNKRRHTDTHRHVDRDT